MNPKIESYLTNLIEDNRQQVMNFAADLDRPFLCFAFEHMGDTIQASALHDEAKRVLNAFKGTHATAKTQAEIEKGLMEDIIFRARNPIKSTNPLKAICEEALMDAKARILETLQTRFN